ncbi:hypothetical protein ACPRNU_25075 [Chromobacterium vaccinii]|uniref:hypothetical protein n=1 Tax=Chromobacterium vaccinii TaxID=1108595 RepID=UPI003C775A53
MRKLAIGVLAAVAVTGCSEKPKIEECWTPGAKQTVTRMVTDAVMEAVGDQVKSDGSPFDAKAQEAVKKNLHLTVGDFAAMDANSAGVLFCGASVDFKFDKVDGGSLGGRIGSLPFSVQPGEKEKYYVIPNTLPIKNLVDSAK